MTRDRLILELILDKLRHWKDRKILYYRGDDLTPNALVVDNSKELDIAEVYYIPPSLDRYGSKSIYSDLYMRNTESIVGEKRCSSECENVIIL